MVKRKTEVSLESALNNIYLESSLKPTGNKKRAKLKKVSLTAPTTPRSERVANFPASASPIDDEWIDDDQVISHDIDHLPVRAKVGGETKSLLRSGLLTNFKRTRMTLCVNTCHVGLQCYKSSLKEMLLHRVNAVYDVSSQR